VYAASGDGHPGPEDQRETVHTTLADAQAAAEASLSSPGV
jgi:hypothetical protein